MGKRFRTYSWEVPIGLLEVALATPFHPVLAGFALVMLLRFLVAPAVDNAVLFANFSSPSLLVATYLLSGGAGIVVLLGSVLTALAGCVTAGFILWRLVADDSRRSTLDGRGHPAPCGLHPRHFEPR